MRDSADVTCTEVAYDQVEAQIVAQIAAQSTASKASSPETSPTASADSNTANMDELLSSILGKQPSPSSSGKSNPDTSYSLEGIDVNIDAEAWLGRFKGLSEAEALQELQVLKYLGGQAGVLRPKGYSGLGLSGCGAVVAAASGNSRKQKRAARLNAKRN